MYVPSTSFLSRANGIMIIDRLGKHLQYQFDDYAHRYPRMFNVHKNVLGWRSEPPTARGP